MSHDHEIYGVIRSRCSNTGAPGSRGSKKIEETRYLENIRKWHKDCWWRHEKWRDGKRIVYYGMVGVKEIADLLFGIENNGSITIVDGNSKNFMLRLQSVSCHVSGMGREYQLIMWKGR